MNAQYTMQIITYIYSFVLIIAIVFKSPLWSKHIAKVLTFINFDSYNNLQMRKLKFSHLLMFVELCYQTELQWESSR